MSQELIEKLNEIVASGTKKADLEESIGLPKNSLSAVLSGAKEMPKSWMEKIDGFLNPVVEIRSTTVTETITNVGNTIKHVNGEESIFGRAPNPLNKVEINPPQEMLINDNQINYPKKWGAIRFDPNNNSKQATLKENKFCIDNAPTNWPNLYIFVAVPYVSINNNLFCKN